MPLRCFLHETTNDMNGGGGCSVTQIAISTAPHESQTLAFNHVGLTLNNSFFLHNPARESCPISNEFNINAIAAARVGGNPPHVWQVVVSLTKPGGKCALGDARSTK